MRWERSFILATKCRTYKKARLEKSSRVRSCHINAVIRQRPADLHSLFNPETAGVSAINEMVSIQKKQRQSWMGRASLDRRIFEVFFLGLVRNDNVFP
jgi:hypothetical protein